MRTVDQDAELNDLYALIERTQDWINSLPGNRQYIEFPGWVEQDKWINDILGQDVIDDVEDVGWDDPRSEEEKELDKFQSECDETNFGTVNWFKGIQEVPY